MKTPCCTSFERLGLAGDYAFDLLIEAIVLVELKVAKAIDELHLAQGPNYLKPAGLHLFPAPQLRQASPGDQARRFGPVGHCRLLRFRFFRVGQTTLRRTMADVQRFPVRTASCVGSWFTGTMRLAFPVAR
jgi:hypothetical protein